MLSRILLLLVLLAPAVATADVFFDGSMGPGGAAPTRSTPGFDSDYLVVYDERVLEPERQGERRGDNLFQSLDHLNLLVDERASFQALDSGGAAILGLERVIARVTSGDKSLIEGVLRSEIPGADFFLLNPAGIEFKGSDGRRLQLDMPAGFTASTADYLRFDDPLNPDGVVFEVMALENFSLSTGAVESYGFLGDNRGEVRFDFSQPELLPGERFQVVAGDVVVTGNTIVRMPGGVIEIAAVGDGALEVPFDIGDWKTRDGPRDTYGEIVVDEFSEVRPTDGLPTDPQGRVILRGGRLVIDDARVQAGGNDGPDVLALDVEMADEIDVRNFSRLQTSGNQEDGVGAGRLSAPLIRVRDNNTFVGSRPNQSTSGVFSVDADVLLVSGAALLGTEASFVEAGGDLVIHADLVRVEAGGVIGTNVSGDEAQGGKLTIVADDEIVVGEGGAIRSENVISLFGREFAGGQAGDLDLTAERLSMAPGGRIEAFTGPEGDGGNVIIHVGTLDMATAAQIRTTTLGDRDAGDVTIVATELVEIFGDDPNAPTGIFARTGTLLGDSLVSGTGNGGDISVSAPVISLTGSSVVSSRSRGEGNPGSIEVTATQLLRLTGTEAGSAEISARARNGDTGGAIAVTAGEVLLESGGAITASTSGTSPGGSILIVADSLVVTGERPGISPDTSAILSDTISENADGGDAGLIDIDLAESLLVEEGGEIRARTKGGGNAGSIDIDAKERVVIRSGGLVTANAVGTATGEAGNIEIDAPVIEIEGGSVTTEAAFGNAAGEAIGGNIVLDSERRTRLTDGALVSASSFGSQDAGRITLDAGNSLVVKDSRIATDATVETENAAGGQIDIFAKDRVEFTRSEVSTSVRAFEGNEDGGNIFIDPAYVVVNSSDILAQAFLGNGGQIDIQAGVFLESVDGFVDASSLGGGIDGVVNVSAPDTELKGELTELPGRFLDASSLLREHCAARVSGGGSFVVAGTEAPFSAPDRSLPARMPLPDAPERGSGAASGEVSPASVESTRLQLAALDCQALAYQLDLQGRRP